MTEKSTKRCGPFRTAPNYTQLVARERGKHPPYYALVQYINLAPKSIIYFNQLYCSTKYNTPSPHRHHHLCRISSFTIMARWYCSTARRPRCVRARERCHPTTHNTTRRTLDSSRIRGNTLLSAIRIHPSDSPWPLPAPPPLRCGPSPFSRLPSSRLKCCNAIPQTHRRPADVG